MVRSEDSLEHWRPAAQVYSAIVYGGSLGGPGERFQTAHSRSYLIVPGWILSSFIDYLLHRRENIQTTSGVAESAIHSLMLAEGAVPTLAGLFLDVNAGVLATMVAGFIVHQGTAIWDVFFTAKRRRIGPAEQHIHSALEMLPFCGLSLTACLHPDQFLSLLHLNDLSPDWDLRLKRDPLPANYVALMLGATGAVAALYAEELWRCLNAARRHLTGVNTPCATTELFGSNERSSRSNERSSNCTSSETTLQRRDETE